MGVLSSVRIVEFEGIGPGPFCGMLLADLGADVICINRKGAANAGRAAVYRRGKRMVSLDVKSNEGRQAAVKIASKADGVIEGMRPGVMERLGLGPDVLRAANGRLVYGRMTGWGQDGPLARAAGHDTNYIGLSGAAWYSGRSDGAAPAAPVAPPTLVGDVGGGALYLAVGLLAAIVQARQTGRGAVIDAAVVDGSAHMMNLLMSLRAGGGMPDQRGASMLDGSHFYDVYACADGKFISLGPLEPQFYAQLLAKLNLGDDATFAGQHDIGAWPQARARLTQIFAQKPRRHWCDLLEGSDVCFAPVLSPGEAADHPHIKARQIYRTVDGVLQTAAAPRFDGAVPADPSPPPESGAHSEEILREAGLCDAEISALTAE